MPDEKPSLSKLLDGAKREADLNARVADQQHKLLAFLAIKVGAIEGFLLGRLDRDKLEKAAEISDEGILLLGEAQEKLNAEIKKLNEGDVA